VIGNPPYIRQELLKEIKPYLKEKYEVYSGYADLYQYFVQKGIEVLSTNGCFHYIVSNKWMRASYGKPLREWLQNFQIQSIIDFGDLPVFEEATVYPCLLEINKKLPDDLFQACEVESLDFTDLEHYLGESCFESDQEKLSKEVWTLLDKESQSILSKLGNSGIKLKEHVNGEIYRGLITGLNDAFVIDEETREKLINKHKSSEKVIQKYLSGKDINRFIPPNSDKYLINIPNGWTDKKFSNRDDKWEAVQEELPAIADYLSKYKKAAKKRYDQGEYWWELRACAYLESFEEEKICWRNLQSRGEFTFDKRKHYINAPSVFIPTDEFELIGILNSNLGWFFLSNTTAGRRGGYYEIKPFYIEQFPIVKPQTDEIKKKVDQILSTKDKDPEADISELEEEIDQLVYELYGLSEEEIGIVEGSISRN